MQCAATHRKSVGFLFAQLDVKEVTSNAHIIGSAPAVDSICNSRRTGATAGPSTRCAAASMNEGSSKATGAGDKYEQVLSPVPPEMA